MPLVRTNGVLAIVDRARTRDYQRPWPAKYVTYRPLAHTERKIHTYTRRKGWSRSAAVGEAKIPLFVAFVASPLL